MKKKLTRKEAERLLKYRFGEVRNDGSDRDLNKIGFLCQSLPHRMWDDWDECWKLINTKNHNLMWRYFDIDSPEGKYAEISFLRLLTAHIFIRENYK